MPKRPPVILDARDAYATPLRGWGRYALELAKRLPPDLVTVYRGHPKGPEVLAEQLVLPLPPPGRGERHPRPELLPAFVTQGAGGGERA